jgi:N-acetylglucosamine-6-phosphate deacetylase
MHRTNLKFGTTSFLPTIYTADFNDVLKALEVVKEWFSMYGNTRGVIGLHIEGPFISKVKKGIHRENYIIKPSDERLE